MTNFEKFATGLMVASLAFEAARDLWRRHHGNQAPANGDEKATGDGDPSRGDPNGDDDCS